MEGPQAAESIHEEELENVCKVKDPNIGRVSRSHVNSLPHHLPPLLTHFLYQFPHSYFRCWYTAPAKTGVQVLSFLIQPEDFNEGNLPPLDDFEGMGFMPTLYSLRM